MNKAILLLLILASSIGLNAQDSLMSLSIKEACELGIERNVNVRNAELDKQKASYQYREAQSKLFPQLEGYSQLGYNFEIPRIIIPGEIFGMPAGTRLPVQMGAKYDWSSGFKASMLLYNQSYLTSLKVARQMENLSELSLQQQKEEVVYQVSQVYYLCQNTQKQLELLTKILTNNDNLSDIAKLQSEAGVIRKLDYSRVQVNINNVQTQLDNIKQLNKQQIELLKFLIGVDPAQEVVLTSSLSDKQMLVSADTLDYNKRTEVQLLNKQMELSELSLKINRQAYLPTLAAMGQYYYQAQRDEFDFLKSTSDEKFYEVGFVGVNLTLPLFDGFEKRSKIKQQKIELLKIKNTKENATRFFSKEYTDAVRQYNTYYSAMLRQRENITIAEDAYNTSLLEYKQHVASLSDLLLSEASLTEAQLSYYNALMQLQIAELEIKKAKGELLNF